MGRRTLVAAEVDPKGFAERKLSQHVADPVHANANAVAAGVLMEC